MTQPERDASVCVVGAGYVGIITAAGLASLGRTVRVAEIDPVRRAAVEAGRAPIHEPGLDELLGDCMSAGRLSVHAEVADAVAGAGVVIIAVGTPPNPDGDADLSQVRTAVTEAAEHADRGTVIAIKSTVPPGTTLAFHRSVERSGISVVMCPEFLREGQAIHDFHHPSRLVVGGEDVAACRRVAALFEPLGGPVILTDATSAEMIKYGANAFLALKISFINEIAHLCELTGATVDAVADGMGLDPRVGRSFLNAGLGFGGSCFPKDVRALEATAGYHGHSFWLLKAAIEVNAQMRRRFVGKIRDALDGVAGKRIAVLGLAFKPGTDDMRQAPAIEIIRHLQDLGATVVATDPVAIERAQPLLPATTMVDDPYDCVRDADAVVLVTEWPQFVELDWPRVATLMRGAVVIDGRNCLDGERLAASRVSYLSVGRRPILPD